MLPEKGVHGQISLSSIKYLICNSGGSQIKDL